VSRRRALAAVATLLAAYALFRVAVVARVRRFERFDPDAEELPGLRLYIRGRRVHLRVEGQGPPLLLVHGFGGSGVTFRRLAPLLRDQYTVIAPDLPGFGFSDRSPAADYSYEAQAGFLLELLDRLGVQQTAVIGHSIGAAISLRLAAVAPGRVATLILVSGPGSLDPIAPRWSRPAVTVLAPLLGESRRFYRWAYRSAMAVPSLLDEEALEEYFAAARVRGNAATMVTILSRTRHGPLPAPERITMPVLILTGASDGYLSPARARALAAGFADAEAVVIPEAGHLAVEEQPEHSAAAIGGFLTRTGYAFSGQGTHPA
jgi:magnesium chelatase accessory protein